MNESRNQTTHKPRTPLNPPDDRFAFCVRKTKHTLRNQLAADAVGPAGKRLGRPWRTSQFDFVRGCRRARVRENRTLSFGASAVEQGRGCGSRLDAGAAGNGTPRDWLGALRSLPAGTGRCKVVLSPRGYFGDAD
ncbi:hypothetical protein MTO96_017443 [Rhipicephalus appendiculatus]